MSESLPVDGKEGRYVEKAGNQALIYAGELEPLYLNRLEGHPYLDTKDYRKGTLAFDGIVYPGVEMRLNVYLEKLIVGPHHVELQIIADQMGNTVALGERDCSMQRRNQKVLEESPSPLMTPELRKAMQEAAVRAAKACGYYNAGTIEFLVDDDRNFYFMEMNTRIQVEHGVTEMVTGTDLIIEQIRVAMGEELSFKQEDIRIKGHAIECRINAEIPEKNFMPSPGVVQHMHLPAGNGVRVDTALYTGYKIPSEYDSMIAKVIVHAPDREAALQKMRSALDEMVVMGVETNLDFQYQIMKNQVFCDGKADTGFIENVLKIKG